MIAFVSHALAFLAGLLICDLIRLTHSRYRLRQTSRLVVRMGGPLELAVTRWASDPHNWCNRPGCPRCWQGWGRP
ncbi:hypothetical protein [Nonomuraea soli]|uniref:Uncharacterized protein n=1 Tax=Nonomuraea soli TaxID=1032476 RepID=A0A7W0CSR2_9ACTN|nr:hypothetical protein [Nonomuraea soli]MBA2896641.1 hypothetical protein [Nonomuraea soli]